MAREGVDYAWGTLTPAALHGAGKSFAIGYLSYDPGKNLTPAESRAFSDGKIAMAVVWETTANRPLSGFKGGVEDARAADRMAKQLWMPAGRPIYFAIDIDETPGQAGTIYEYFKGINSVIGVKRTGAYGGYWAIKRLFDAHAIEYGWQTYAWSGGNWDHRAQLQQYSNGHTVGGVSVDFDRALAHDFGQWRIGKVPVSARLRRLHRLRVKLRKNRAARRKMRRRALRWRKRIDRLEHGGN